MVGDLSSGLVVDAGLFFGYVDRIFHYDQMVRLPELYSWYQIRAGSPRPVSKFTLFTSLPTSL